MAYKFEKDEMIKLGQIYRNLLYIINAQGRDPYPNSDIFPYRCFIMVMQKAMHIGIPKRLDKEIAKFMDRLNPDELTEAMSAQVPPEMKMYWFYGFETYKQLIELSKLEKLRKEKKLTQKALADKVGVSQKDISRWETLSVSPGTEKLKKMADALGCSLDDLV